ATEKLQQFIAKPVSELFENSTKAGGGDVQVLKGQRREGEMLRRHKRKGDLG
ncbi:hypothetical protein A2U01_0082699, partial [Trifolium medium]|nr:hypothetical protein [Trifolium medium]